MFISILRNHIICLGVRGFPAWCIWYKVKVHCRTLILVDVTEAQGLLHCFNNEIFDRVTISLSCHR
uniref:Uncharacterized protein n=1 Tax=Rhizophora mucronata TaxID=61149 RepID=A0A2P2MUX8_RHIMU